MGIGSAFQKPAARHRVEELTARFGPNDDVCLPTPLAHEDVAQTSSVGIDLLGIGHTPPVIECVKHARRDRLELARHALFERELVECALRQWGDAQRQVSDERADGMCRGRGNGDPRAARSSFR